MFDLPYQTSCWLVERLSDGRHARQMIFARYLKFVSSCLKNRRSSVQSLCELVSRDIRTVTGRNLRLIQEETSVPVIAGVTRPSQLRDWAVYETPEGQEWRLPLLVSLLEVREGNWEVKFDEEEDDSLVRDDIEAIIVDIATLR